jgi:hypothetical protein
VPANYIAGMKGTQSDDSPERPVVSEVLTALSADVERDLLDAIEATKHLLELWRRYWDEEHSRAEISRARRLKELAADSPWRFPEEGRQILLRDGEVWALAAKLVACFDHRGLVANNAAYALQYVPDSTLISVLAVYLRGHLMSDPGFVGNLINTIGAILLSIDASRPIVGDLRKYIREGIDALEIVQRDSSGGDGSASENRRRAETQRRMVESHFSNTSAS